MATVINNEEEEEEHTEPQMSDSFRMKYSFSCPAGFPSAYCTTGWSDELNLIHANKLNQVLFGKKQTTRSTVLVLKGLEQSFPRARQLDCWLGEKPGETLGLILPICSSWLTTMKGIRIIQLTQSGFHSIKLQAGDDKPFVYRDKIQCLKSQQTVGIFLLKLKRNIYIFCRR